MLELLQRIYSWMTVNSIPEDEEAMAILLELETAMESLRAGSSVPDPGPRTEDQGPVPAPRTGDLGVGSGSPSLRDLQPGTRTLKSPLSNGEILDKILKKVKLHEGWGKKDYAAAISSQVEIYVSSKESEIKENALIEVAAFAISALHSDAANAALK